ncbi:pilus assembly protein N-terminal domain-containing protein [Hansschlegelia zhihuaiae]|uniref:Pilus assembly protein n=1 Tax=Hansschlegelia zhihuaiae TaxID=405005 RepID=A0A4Q0MKM3_9HYPH|nr:pilus assembly protein N-terminal domain-containing protein [Hansschlegelia zhihuaiae]RXF73649.1 pilus assembly protein [Hansschlegelia zhihuaiae]
MATSFAAHLRALGVSSVLILTGPAVAVEATINVAVDHASVVRAPDNVATVIVGNPMIADATTQKNGVVVITGKTFGSTNVMLLDGAGAVLSETIVNVRRAPETTLVVQRGNTRESFSCTPRCDPLLTIGDEKEIFKDTANQIAQRGGLSTGKGVE